jgi:isopenicillin N synthase-like dioxygenase
MSDFTSIPIIDFSLAKTNKPLFLSQLRHALINVGFLYLSNSSVDPSLVKNLKAYLDPLFALPQDVKDGIKMSNSQHFLGYTKLGAEFTKGSLDQREQFDFATQHQCRWTEGEEDFVRLWGEGQWPPESLVPGFRKTFLDYFSAVADLSYSFASLTAEALGLHPDALNKFYDEPRKELMQHRGKIARYPPAREGQSSQGVGAHFDPGFLTFVSLREFNLSLCVSTRNSLCSLFPLIFTVGSNVSSCKSASPKSWR